MGIPIFWILLGVGLLAAPAAGQDLSLRFFGNGVAAPQQDRVKIRLDGPARPVDVGATDFTVEFWMKAGSGNGSGNCVSGGDGWINGNILIDRDVFGGGDLGDYGLSLFGGNGRIAFGVAVGGSGQTLCGATNVIDGAWHHIAATRRASDGLLRLFVDGQLDASADGPDGDASYADGRSTGYPDSDPFLVLGAEKHDAGAAYPSYRGWLDELRLSTVLRYTGSFTPPAAPFTSDAATAALYHFDEGPVGPCTGMVLDSSGAAGGPSDGTCEYGGSPAGPLYSADSPFHPPPPPLCGAAPLSSCRAAGRSTVLLRKHADPARDTLVWKWLKGDATALADFGVPLLTTDYALCVYDASGGPGTLVVAAAAAPGFGWRALGSGFSFTNAGAPGGLSKLLLQSGVQGRAKVLAKGKGPDLALPSPLPFGANPVAIVQLVNREGECWSTTFTGAARSDAGLLKARN